MNILVTGSAGFTGRNIAKYFSTGEYMIFSHVRGQYFPQESFDVVIHCAAAAGPWYSASDIARDNIDFTNNLLKLKIGKLFFISSVMATGTTAYGLSKLFCEHLIGESKIPAISFRCPGIVGPNCTGRNWAARLMREIRDDKEITLYNISKQFNSVIHVEDIAKTIERLIHKNFNEHLVINLAASEPISVGGAARALATGLGKKLEYKIVYRPFSGAGLIETPYDFRGRSVEETMLQFGRESRDEQN